MQDLKKSKRRMNANQMTNAFLSNEEAMDAIDHLDGSQIDGIAIRLYYQ